jgi:hypothetical protein
MKRTEIFEQIADAQQSAIQLVGKMLPSAKHRVQVAKQVQEIALRDELREIPKTNDS